MFWASYRNIHVYNEKRFLNQQHRRYFLLTRDNRIRGGKNQSMWDTILQPWPPALFDTSGGECKVPVIEMFHSYSCNMLVRQESQQVASEATVLENVITAVRSTNTALVFFLLQNSSQCFKSAKLLNQRLISHAEIRPAQWEAVG